ncbi:hypothetical protein [Anoxynatronum buryatiense]|nr:hypothetical protein [Anoxynatronum buryatiense]
MRFEEYLDVTARVEMMAYKIITDLVNMIQSNNHDVAKLLDMLYEIEDVKKMIPIEHDSYREMRMRNQDIAKATYDLVILVYESGGTYDNNRRLKWSEITDELSFIMNKRTEVIIRLFQAEGIDYHLNTDGSLSYSIQK